MEALLQHIQFRLATRKFCIVSERELGRAWPFGENRAELIQEFANANNLSATINESGTRVRFKKLPAP